MPVSDVIFGMVLCAAICAVTVYVRGFLLGPVRPRGDVFVWWLVTVKGDCEGMEETMRTIRYLRDSGKSEAGLLVAAEELTPEGQRKAEALCAKYGGIMCRTEEIEDVVRL